MLMNKLKKKEKNKFDCRRVDDGRSAMRYGNSSLAPFAHM